MGAFIAGLLGGIGQSMQKERQQKTLMDLQRQEHISEMLMKMSENPDITPDQAQEAHSMALGMMTGQVKMDPKVIVQKMADWYGKNKAMAAQAQSDNQAQAVQNFRTQLTSAPAVPPPPIQPESVPIPNPMSGVPMQLPGASEVPPPPTAGAVPGTSPPTGAAPVAAAPPLNATKRQLDAFFRQQELQAHYDAQYGAMRKAQTEQEKQRYKEGIEAGMKPSEALYFSINRPIPATASKFVPGVIPGTDPRITGNSSLNADPTKLYRARIDPSGNITEIYQQEMRGLPGKPYPNPASLSTGWSVDVYSPDGRTVIATHDAIPPAGFIPLVRESSRDVVVQTPQGPTVFKVGGKTTSTRTLPGSSQKSSPTVVPPVPGTPTPQGAVTPTNSTAATPSPGQSGGRVLSGRPIPLATKRNMMSQLAAYTNTADIINDIVPNIGELTNMITAKLIDMASDPKGGLVHAAIARGAKLTPEQVKLAQDFASLSEHINVIRQPLGGTGYRSTEAWAAMQQMRGSPMARPDVTIGVLKNTMKVLMKQRAINETMLADEKRTIPKPDTTAKKGYLFLADGDPSKAKQLAQADGYSVD